MTQVVATLADALLRAHRDLLASLQELHDAVDRSPIEEAPSELAFRLALARERLAQHFRFEEENGYLDTILEMQPQMARTVQRLHVDHDNLLFTMDRLIDAIEAASTVTDDARAQVRTWLLAVRRHEQAENVLIQDAYTLDIATGD